MRWLPALVAFPFLLAGCTGAVPEDRPFTAAEDAMAREAAAALAAALGPNGDVSAVDLEVRVQVGAGQNVSMASRLDLLQGDAFRYTARFTAIDEALLEHEVWRLPAGATMVVTCRPEGIQRSWLASDATDGEPDQTAGTPAQGCLGGRLEDAIQRVVGWGPTGVLAMPASVLPPQLEVLAGRVTAGEPVAECKVGLAAKTIPRVTGSGQATFDGGRVASLAADFGQLSLRATFTYGERLAA